MTAGKLAKEPGVPLAYLLADNDVLADIILAVARMSPAEQRGNGCRVEGQGQALNHWISALKTIELNDLCPFSFHGVWTVENL